MQVLIVKLSSLGDVIHTLPAACDIRDALPEVRIHWAVETGFAPLLARCDTLDRVITVPLSQWAQHPFAAQTRRTWRRFREQLASERYDAVIDLQGLSKSAWVAWMARLADGGQRYAMAHATDGSSYERPTRWVANVALSLPRHIHALTRARQVCSQALGYGLSPAPRFGMGPVAGGTSRQVLLAHGTTRADKEWPESHWLALGRQLQAGGWQPVLTHGNPQEQRRAERLAQGLPGAELWPRLSLDALTDRMAACAGVVGVDTGLSHLAVALDLPHVQIYNWDTAWRTGPLGRPHQVSVYAKPYPSVDEVWQAWQQVCRSP